MPAYLRRLRLLTLPFSVSVLLLLGHAAAGCSQCGAGGDTATTEDLTAYRPDAGADGAIAKAPSCSTCPGPVVEEALCGGECYPAPNSYESTPCVRDACVETVTNPASSCASVCSALLYVDGNLTGCSFSADRSKVTCNTSQNGSCRCSFYDC